MHINYHVVGGFFDEFCKYLGKCSCKLNFSALYQMRKTEWWNLDFLWSLVNKIGRCFWSHCNCDLISTSNLGFFFDIKNSILDTIKILIICLQNNNSVTTFSSSEHICYTTDESKKMKRSLIHEILPPEMVEKILKLLDYNDIYQSQLVCRRWKEIIDLGNLVKKSRGKCLI